jgi:hypothetical protein
MIIRFVSVIFVAGFVFGAMAAHAHCDAVDGPVAKVAIAALEDGNINPVLAYAPATAEEEIRAAFERSRAVRGLGGHASELAEHAFLETVIRLHRAGEGAAYTGLKPAGIDYGPVIPAAEKAVQTGDLAALKALLVEEIEHALTERLAQVRELKDVPLNPKTSAEVPHARKRVSSELGFITFAETLRQAALGRGSEHHID